MKIGSALPPVPKGVTRASSISEQKMPRDEQKAK
jgi:hypothetical protein